MSTYLKNCYLNGTMINLMCFHFSILVVYVKLKRIGNVKKCLIESNMCAKFTIFTKGNKTGNLHKLTTTSFFLMDIFETLF